MAQDLSTPGPAAPPPPGPTVSPAPRPENRPGGLRPDERMVREVWPTVVGVNPAAAQLAKKLVGSVVLLPAGVALLAPLFALKFAPFLCKRYTLTNRRLMIRRGLRPSPVQEVALADIDEVRLGADPVDAFYRSGTLEVVSHGQVVLTLPGVPEPEGFRHAVVNTVKAWVPGKANGAYQSATTFK